MKVCSSGIFVLKYVTMEIVMVDLINIYTFLQFFESATAILRTVPDVKDIYNININKKT